MFFPIIHAFILLFRLIAEVFVQHRFLKVLDQQLGFLLDVMEYMQEQTETVSSIPFSLYALRSFIRILKISLSFEDFKFFVLFVFSDHRETALHHSDAHQSGDHL